MCSLTDPLIWDNETISMEVTVRGSYPGNMFDMTPYVQLSDTSDNFTADNHLQIPPQHQNHDHRCASCWQAS